MALYVFPFGTQVMTFFVEWWLSEHSRFGEEEKTLRLVFYFPFSSSTPFSVLFPSSPLSCPYSASACVPSVLAFFTP